MPDEPVLAIALVVAVIALLGFDVLFHDLFGPFIVMPIALLPFGLMGALLMARVPGNIVGWLLGAAGLFFAMMFAGAMYAYVAFTDTAIWLPGGLLVALIFQTRTRPRSVAWSSCSSTSRRVGASAAGGRGGSAGLWR